MREVIDWNTRFMSADFDGESRTRINMLDLSFHFNWIQD